MGHESTTITEQVYMHISPEMHIKGKQVLDEIFNDNSQPDVLKIKVSG